MIYYAKRFQMLFGSDSGQHKQLRRIDGTGAHYDLPVGVNHVREGKAVELDGTGPLVVVEYDLRLFGYTECVS